MAQGLRILGAETLKPSSGSWKTLPLGPLQERLEGQVAGQDPWERRLQCPEPQQRQAAQRSGDGNFVCGG